MTGTPCAASSPAEADRRHGPAAGIRINSNLPCAFHTGEIFDKLIKPPPEIRGGSACQKVSQSLPLQAANKVKKVFCRGLYLAENTAQAASVEFVPRRWTNYPRGRLQKACRKAPEGFFRQFESRPGNPGRLWFLRLIHPAGSWQTGNTPAGSRHPQWW